MNKTQKIFGAFFVAAVILWIAWVVIIIESVLLIFAEKILPSILYDLIGGIFVFALLSTYATTAIRDQALAKSAKNPSGIRCANCGAPTYKTSGGLLKCVHCGNTQVMPQSEGKGNQATEKETPVVPNQEQKSSVPFGNLDLPNHDPYDLNELLAFAEQGPRFDDGFLADNKQTKKKKQSDLEL